MILNFSAGSVLVYSASVITIERRNLERTKPGFSLNTACLFTISAPSGAGKTSLVKALLERRAESIVVCVSHSTRAMRPGEVDGEAYHFVSLEAFEKMVVDDEFLEHARVFDNSYGTARASVNALLASGKHVILEIDWQGARQVKAKMPETVSIFILPPSREELERRLRDRGTDDESTIARRMRDADREMSHYHDAEYLVINDAFDQALFDLDAIIHTQGLTLARQKLKNKALVDSIPPEME
jgi:guanylate kinase